MEVKTTSLTPLQHLLSLKQKNFLAYKEELFSIALRQSDSLKIEGINSDPQKLADILEGLLDQNYESLWNYR